MTYTAVFVHAHPDDEALFTSGTMADLALQGHRVVLVVCTDGAEGLAAEVARGRDLAAVRRAELETSAEALGVSFGTVLAGGVAVRPLMSRTDT